MLSGAMHDEMEPVDDDVDESERELAELRRPPTGEEPLPPPRPLLQTLPFNLLDWPDFEKLIERLVRLEGDAERVSRYGTRGQDQEGIDIYSRLPGGAGYVVYQCKRYAELGAAVIRYAVQEFLDNPWSETASRFVFCTSHSLVPTSLAREIETQAERLREHDPPIVLDGWGEDDLSDKLKSHPELVEDFFGAPYFERFSPGGAERPAESRVTEATAQQLTAAIEAVAPLLLTQRQQVVVSTLDWAPAALKDTLKHLADNERDAFLALRDLVGEPPSIEVVVANITVPPAWLPDASAAVW
jgi:hypothetical protein